MSMRAESLEIPENADVPSSQAHAIVRAIEIEIAGAKDIRCDFREAIGDFRNEFSKIRDEIKADIRAGARRICRHMYVALLGQTVVLLGTGYFLATHLSV